jgi:phosphohistidine phosphatase SixA
MQRTPAWPDPRHRRQMRSVDLVVCSVACRAAEGLTPVPRRLAPQAQVLRPWRSAR